MTQIGTATSREGAATLMTSVTDLTDRDVAALLCCCCAAGWRFDRQGKCVDVPQVRDSMPAGQQHSCSWQIVGATRLSVFLTVVTCSVLRFAHATCPVL